MEPLRPVRRILAVVAALLSAPAPAQEPAQELRGEGQVLGADALSVAGASFQLWGIDAPEMNQPCYIDGVGWECGPAAARKLAEIVSLGPLVCTLRRDSDRTRRANRYAVCRNGTGADVALEMVRAGMAYAVRSQSPDYAAAEDAARAARIGIFRGVSAPPWEFRDMPRN